MVVIFKIIGTVAIASGILTYVGMKIAKQKHPEGCCIVRS